ncbi:poly-gamma-glutamate biosynthesis protein [Legionella norrlandica]|uniref:Poly-gamma-glutamate biosynthesis protein n=1 Tax=Legionella norrlandica TaxID=1498499 RepID=A0A0A2SPS7_9GAMM|nr:CapA family protein [Legionella norrlandica]KGP62757.1 poly-gamma-glutamate biosynthesis protein [Legionella norrlandica]
MFSMQEFQVFLCGDVMIGRGIDQILPHPSDPRLYEPYVKDAKDYVLLAENTSGEIPRGVCGNYLWGDGLYELKKRNLSARIINLETSITKSNTPDLYKGIHYKMNPDNIDAITSAAIDVCALANNHILDWGTPGLLETLETLHKANIRFSGAGHNIQEAQAPAILSIPGHKKRILVFSMGIHSSGIPSKWRATLKKPGLWLLDNLNANTIRQIKERIDYHREPCDLCIVSIHWGGNWGYAIPKQHQNFAHALIDEIGVNIIHGHSSHHPIGIEIYNHCPILYGCGDLINDYEGILGYEEFQKDLSLMYFLTFDDHLYLKKLELVPLIRKNFCLHYPSDSVCQSVFKTITKASMLLDTHFELENRTIHWIME